MPVMLGFAGLGIEVGSWLWNVRAMQGAADAASVSAADALAFDSKGDPTAYQTEALSVAAVNGWTNGSNGIAVTVNNPPTSGAYAGNNSAVEVIITEPGTNWFSGFLPGGYAAPALKARSVALSNPDIDCVLSLSATAVVGVSFDFSASGSVNMPNCGIGVNSAVASALQIAGRGSAEVIAYSATVNGGISSGALLPQGCANPNVPVGDFCFKRAPAQNSGILTPDPYPACPATVCRTMPTPATPVAIRSLATIPTLGPVTVPANCPGAAMVLHKTTRLAIPAGCSQGISVTAGTATLSTGNCTPANPCAILGISVAGGATLIINGGGTLQILGTTGPAISAPAGATITLNNTSNFIQGGSGQPAISAAGGNITIDGTSASILGGPGAAAINAPSGSVAVGAATSIIQGSQTGTGSNAIAVAGATVTIGGNATTILGGSGGTGILATSGLITLNATTDEIEGGSGSAAIYVTGGAVTIAGRTDSILGGTGGAGIYTTGGTVAINAPANTIEGGTGEPAIQLTGASPVLSFAASNNRILAGAGSPAITVSGTTFAQLTFGNGNNSIQGAASDGGAFSAMTMAGLANVTFGNGTTIFGGRAVTRNVPAVNDAATFAPSLTSHQGLTLGSGTFQFMEGLTVTGGNLTLNPAAGSGGAGSYIMDGGSNGGLTMTAGDLVGSNATIVLTGSGSDFANLNLNLLNGISLTAPAAGSTAGIAIFQDRNAPAGNSNVVNGTSFDNITGAIYAPNGALQFTGAGVTSQCTQLIAATVTIFGQANLNNQCDGTGVAPIGGDGAIILVE